MVKSSATTVEEYLSQLPEEKRQVIATVRELILRNLPAGYREAMQWGMIGYAVPLERFPTTYNGQPLGYISLAAQKNYYSLYLMAIYEDSEQERQLREEFRKAGKKLDMGKSCLRFRRLQDVPWDVIALYEVSRRVVSGKKGPKS